MPIVSAVAFLGNKAGLMIVKQILLNWPQIDRKWFAFNYTEDIGVEYTEGGYGFVLQCIETKLNEQ